MNKLFFPIIASFFVTIAAQMEFIWTHDARNQRPVMERSEYLMAAAQWKAEYIASTGDLAHRTKYGEDPNETIHRFGCNNDYAENQNNVESYVWGTNHAPIAYSALIDSPSHRNHLLGETETFRVQDKYGIGHADLIFVFITANCES